MIRRLVTRSLRHRPGRSLLLLVGYALGVGVTVALLSIGSALVQQSRDRSLVGGGDLTVLPAGLDLETFRTGGASSLYFTVDQAPFLYRQVLAGPRFSDRIAAAAPWIDDEVLYLELPGEGAAAEERDGAGAPDGERGERLAVSAGGRIPSLARRLDAPDDVTAGVWNDVPADRRWTSPDDSTLYAEIDAFHLPPPAATADSSWAEWHYFNVLLPGGEGWLYLTYMVAGDVPDGRWGGRLLGTLVTRARDGTGAGGEPRYRTRQFQRDVPAEEVAFSLVRPDLRIGGASLALDPEGRYRLRAEVPPAGTAGEPRGEPAGDAGDGDGERAGGGPAARSGEASLRLELTVTASRRSHLPPLDVAPGDFTSGYVVPVLDGRAEGRVCLGDVCRELDGSPAYHDHNWGTWSGVAWDWGHARAGPVRLLYGGVRREDAGPASGSATPSPVARNAAGATSRAEASPVTAGRRFLFVTDSLGFAGLFTIDRLEHRWRRRAAGGRGPVRRPEALAVDAARGIDTVRLRATVRHARSTRPEGRVAVDRPLLFWQMRGEARVEGRLGDRPLAESGDGFFETWAPEAGPDDPGEG